MYTVSQMVNMTRGQLGDYLEKLQLIESIKDLQDKLLIQVDVSKHTPKDLWYPDDANWVEYHPGIDRSKVKTYLTVRERQCRFYYAPGEVIDFTSSEWDSEFRESVVAVVLKE